MHFSVSLYVLIVVLASYRSLV